MPTCLTGGKWNYELASADDRQATLAEGESLGEVAATDLDVTDKASCEAAVQATLARFGGLDVLVNNAGVLQSGPVEAFAEADWDRVFAVNVKGIFLMTQAALPALKASSDAAIVNTASIAGKKGIRNLVPTAVPSSPRWASPKPWRRSSRPMGYG